MDNFITGNPDNLAHLSGNPNFSFIRHDVANFIFVPGKVDAVMPFRFSCQPQSCFTIRLPQPADPDHESRRPGNSQYPGGGTGAWSLFPAGFNQRILRRSAGAPAKRNLLGPCRSHRRAFVYDEAKRFAEALTMAYHRYHGLDTRIVRIFNTYGPRMRLDDGRVVPNFLRAGLDGLSR